MYMVQLFVNKQTVEMTLFDVDRQIFSFGVNFCTHTISTGYSAGLDCKFFMHVGRTDRLLVAVQSFLFHWKINGTARLTIRNLIKKPRFSLKTTCCGAPPVIL